MPFSNNNGSPMPFASFRRPILTIRNDAVHSEISQDPSIPDSESFQRLVFTLFHELSVVNPDELLSLSWMHKLLDAFATCHEDFKVIVCNNKERFSKSPADRLVIEFFDRAIKALDIFNAARDGIEKIRLWQKQVEIIVCALDTRQRILGEGQLRRARKALMDLELVMLDDKESCSIFSQRNRSFGRKGKDSHHHRSSLHSRSLSWSVSHNWSASKQLQSIANNLIAPRSNEDGLGMLVFTMSFILMFVLWALVSAIPCQDRGTPTHFAIPRNFSWSTPLFLLHSRISDESKRRDRRNSNGLLREILRIEKSVHQMTDLIDSAQFPLPEEVKEDVRENVYELSLVCEICKSGLDPFERQLRDVFRKMTSCRAACLESLGKATEP